MIKSSKEDDVAHKRRQTRILVKEREMQAAIASIAARIGAHYRKIGARRVILVCVLRGAFIFCADLIRALGDLNFEHPKKQWIQWRIDFIGASSYKKSGEAMKSSGEVRIWHDLSGPVRGQHVLVVEDVADTNLTLKEIVRLIRVTHQPRSIQIVVMSRKKMCAKVRLRIRFVTMELGPKYVIGMGLDADQDYRWLRDVFEIVWRKCRK